MSLLPPHGTAIPDAMRATLAGGLALGMIGGLLLGQFLAVPGADHVAMVAAVALAVLRVGVVPRIARAFLIVAALAVALVAVFVPDEMPAMQTALMQGTAFSAFLTVLGLIRGPVRASRVIARAAARLFSAPPGRMRAAILYGTQVIAVLFNLGSIAMMADIARDHAARARAEGRIPADSRAITLAAMRGAVMVTVWNPIGVGFAIVTAAIPALDPLQFLILSVTVTMGLVAGWLLLDRRAPVRPDPEAIAAPSGRHQGDRALATVLAAVLGLIAVTVVIHRLAGVSFLVAGVLVLPMLAFLWPRIERGARSETGPGAFAAVAQATASTAAEATIFLAAAVIAAGISAGLHAVGLGATLAAEGVPAIVVILGCLFLVPLAGAALIPHSVVMVLIAQLLGAGPIGAAHPLSLALALCLAWAMAIMASPISAISIITARLLDTTPAHLAFGINRAFTLYGLAGATACVVLVYLFE